MSAKINESLFETPNTTGFVNDQSKYWSTHVTSLNLKRFMSKEYIESNKYATGPNKKLEFEKQLNNLKRDEVREFLEQMISSGKERAQFNEYVDKFTKELDHIGGFEGNEFGWYYEYVSQFV